MWLDEFLIPEIIYLYFCDYFNLIIQVLMIALIALSETLLLLPNFEF